MSEDVVLLAVDDRGVATITLNRPTVNNAYNGDVIAGMTACVGQAAAAPTVRVLVLRANGRHFQAGADLKWLKEIGQLSAAENVDVSRNTYNAVQGLTTVMKPTVALVQGGCFGGGTGILAACDVVIASEDAIFAITEARWGVMAGIIVPHLNAAIGPRNLRRYGLTCERFGADKALEMGLVHQVCPTGDLDEAAAPVIDQLLLSAPEALAQTKYRTLADAGLLIDDAAGEALVVEHSLKRQSNEAIEGLNSFAEKRDPSWYPGAA